MSAPNTYECRDRRRRRHARQIPVRTMAAFVLVALLVIGIGVASAAIIIKGRGTLNVAAYKEQGLQVSDVRLAAPLMPGGTADLLLSVRNPNAFAVRVDQVTLVGGLRKAAPAGCVARVTGPATRTGGYRLPPAEQMLVGAGQERRVTVKAAFALAAAAKSGCGFTVEVDVSATQLAPTTSPTTVKPSTPAPTSTTTAPTIVPTTTPATTPAPVQTPPVAPGAGTDCDTAVQDDCDTP